MKLRILSVLCLLGASCVLASPEKPPVSGGYETQPVGPQQGGYKPSVFLGHSEPKAPSTSYGVVSQGAAGGSSHGAAGAVAGGTSAGGSYAFEYGGGNSVGQGKELGFGPTSFSAGSSSGGGYGPPAGNVDSSYGPPTQAVQGGNGWNAPSTNYGEGQAAAQGPSYTYHYTHYPNANKPHGISPGNEGGGGGGGFSLFDSIGGGWEGGGGEGGAGLAGLGGGVGGIGALIAIGKGILALKPLILLGLLLLVGIPLALLFLPIPIITVTGLPGFGRPTENGAAGGTRQAYGGPSMLQTYISTLSERVLNSEECLERLICKMPQVPGKYQGKAKLMWEHYGKKYFSSARVQRAFTAYFDESQGRARISKCNQKFKCSNKFF